MNNGLMPFSHKQFGQIRTIKDESTGEPRFVAKDVCASFGDFNYSRSISRLEADEKGVSQINTSGGLQKMTTVNEAGLYSLLFYMQPQKGRGVSDAFIQKRTDQLKAFKRWVTHEVINEGKKRLNGSLCQAIIGSTL